MAEMAQWTRLAPYNVFRFVTFFRRLLCFKLVLISIVVLLCYEASFVAGSDAKQYARKENRHQLCLTPSKIDHLLSNACGMRGKRTQSQSGENVLQSPEEARKFLRRSSGEFAINYVLFHEECCVKDGGCRTEEILEHCFP
ncbi:uncharacterized protein LOC144643776 [Oculina patagonica]